MCKADVNGYLKKRKFYCEMAERMRFTGCQERKMKRKDTMGYRFRLIHNQMHKMMEAKRHANEEGAGALTGMQRWALGYLEAHKGEDIYQKDIEAEFAISRATASNMLAVMERKGLIRRISVEHDARLKKLVLTSEACRMLEQANRDIEEMEERMQKGMSPEEVSELRELLNRVLTNLGIEQEW
jgi:DNA-binding MarR family transcriptional regulator